MIIILRRILLIPLYLCAGAGMLASIPIIGPLSYLGVITGVPLATIIWIFKGKVVWQNYAIWPGILFMCLLEMVEKEYEELRGVEK